MNPSSLLPHLDAVPLMKSSLLGISESRLKHLGVPRISKTLQPGYKFLHGKPMLPPQRHTKYLQALSPWDARQGGVALIALKQVKLSPTKLQTHDPSVSRLRQKLWDTRRWMHGVASLRDGPAWHVMVIYGHPETGQNSQAFRSNEELLRDTLRVAAALGPVPTIIMGDFNVTLEESPTLSSALQSQRWFDVNLATAQAKDTNPFNTCFAPHGPAEGRCIDHILINKQLRPFLSDCQQVKGTGVSTHIPFRADLSIPSLPSTYDVIQLPESFPIPDATLWPKDKLEEFAHSCISGSQSQGDLAKSGKNSVSLYTQFAHLFESYWGTCTLDQSSGKQRRKHFGRHKPPTPVCRKISATQNFDDIEALSPEALPLLQLIRLVEDYSRRRKAGSLASDPYWTKIQDGGKEILSEAKWLRYWSNDNIAPGQITALLAQLKHHSSLVQAKAQRMRIKEWKTKMLSDWNSTRTKSFRFLREYLPPPSDIFQLPDGSYTGQFAAIHTNILDAWLPTFAMYRLSHEPPWIPFADRFGQYIIHHQTHLAPLTADVLADSIKAMSVRKAKGLDGWSVLDLKNLPPSFLPRLADIFNVIEETGVWPEHQLTGLISLIPKPGKGAKPEDMRPITVMPILYRLWARTRLKDLIKWQETWALSDMHGFRPLHGPEDIWWELALEIERVLTGEVEEDGTDPQLRGIAFDYAKAYDKLPHFISFQIAEQAGMDPRILKPLRSMCGHLRRRFKAAGGVGPSFVSTNGLTQLASPPIVKACCGLF